MHSLSILPLPGQEASSHLSNPRSQRFHRWPKKIKQIKMKNNGR
nr:MAG TPA: hypothetical protein [Caudoviricetes sp.]